MYIREKALALLETGETVSGEQLAKELGVSRNAVWKVMKRLREDGYEIEAVTNRGYRLVSAPDVMSEAGIRKWLKTRELGRELEIHDRLDSTNNRAKMLAAAGAKHGTVIIADSQSGGRGRQGRSFFSPDHSGVYMTMILRPDCAPDQAGLLTSLAAVATARAVEKTANVKADIKWVNDLYISGRKICGILCEAGLGMEAGKLEYAVAGIGVNTARMQFPPELQEIATSIGNECGEAPERNRLIAEILNETEALLGDLKTGHFLEESRKRSNVIGRTVTVIEGDKRYPAKAVDIDDQGRLVIETEDGRTCLNYGEVSLKLTDNGAEWLGRKKGTIAVGLYLLIGIIGVPVFSGFSGGFQKLAGVTGGYLVGYLPCAYMSGEGAEKRERIGWWYHPLMMIAGTALLYLVGTVNFMLHTGNGLGAALALCVVPFLIGDAVKIAAAALLTVPVRKAVKLIKN